MGLEFAHPEGAKFVMRRLYSRGVWAIFSTLDPRVLQYKPGLLLDPALGAEILEITETAIGEAREDAAGRARRRPAAVTPRGPTGLPGAATGDIPLGDLPSFPADPAARSVAGGTARAPGPPAASRRTRHPSNAR